MKKKHNDYYAPLLRNLLADRGVIVDDLRVQKFDNDGYCVVELDFKIYDATFENLEIVSKILKTKKMNSDIYENDYGFCSTCDCTESGQRWYVKSVHIDTLNDVLLISPSKEPRGRNAE